MKFLHTAFLLLFVASLLHSQTLEVAPAQGNPVLRSFAAQQAVQNAAFVEQLTGVYPQSQPSGDRAGGCPPSLEGNFVASGDSLEISLDTFGLMLGVEPATLTIENLGSLQFGAAVLHDTLLYITYFASPGLTGAEIETLQFKLSQPGHDTIVPIEIFVRRKARVVVTQPQIVQPESITTFCLNSELDFAKPKLCSRSFDGPDNYDGAGQPVFHLSSYDYPDTCLVYYASRFPGVDTVNMRICDEWGVCDIFKVPYIIPGDTVSIASKPFFDDFSYTGPYPSSKFWLDKSVYLNYTLAKDPPSVGLVTFDGLDRRGDVYDIVTGVGDRLTSKAIDLSNYNANSDVFLRFFLAPKGFGLPGDVTDNVVLEFRNASRQWVKVGTYDGIGEDVPIDSFPPFLFYAIKVDDAQFFHKGFQFRFSATTSPGGSVDLWHLDYVQLSKNEGSTDIFPDIAFTELPTSILKNYTAMPWKHFKGHVGDETKDQLTSHFYNHNDDVRALGASSVTFKELSSGSNIGSFFTVVESGTDNNMAPQDFLLRNRTIPAGNFTQIKNELDGIPDGGTKVLETTFSFVESGQLQLFESNDTVKLRNTFSNFFAHDDGTAEWQVFINHAVGGERIASQFHTNVEDTLKAVQIMFPHVNGDVQEQLFNLEIYVGSLDTDPVLVRSLLSPFYPNNVYDTLQGFTTYVLDDLLGTPTPVTIPADSDFFVSFQQASSAVLGIPVGFDLQNACDCGWSNLQGTGWKKFSSGLQGSLMIRPVFGVASNTSSAAHETAGVKPTHFKVYPNPTTGLVNFSLKEGNFNDFQFTVFNNLGQAVSQGNLERSVELGNLPSGAYHLRLLNEKTGELFGERIILAKD
ncbi:MAG: T9SS type A sorting domain-containing protein [Saprospiraceae bacterium]|nr:T9SS type A sorting domain-containing protein [Saprospiraceae bacterium]MCF8250811.1 T9SS type A sorting domain-containing protein [Saprospiraceae bacterium]MCF8282695.1 T9SS type A sorting domain-containing protein [Bacteroidales bacterium]MCF8312612.1 T9SS type A sorting domain-containing protein [Saprospiraceae bacterium]MCF8441002.1 T9SS type A sorting domain-containing protein [Saprospiraceae bacterium]